jgi:hypothetical protein
MDPINNPLILEARRSRLGLKSASIAATSFTALIPAIAQAAPEPHYEVFSSETPVGGSTFNTTVHWNPFAADATRSATDNFLTASFVSGNIFSIRSNNFSEEYTVTFAYSSSTLQRFDFGQEITQNNFVSGKPTGNLYFSLPTGSSTYFAYQIEGPTSGYGWVELLSPSSGQFELGLWGFNFGGDSVTIAIPTTPPSIPEPSAFAAITALFFAGVVGIARFKRRRATAATS